MNGAREAENLRSVYFFYANFEKVRKIQEGQEKLKMIFKCVDRRGKQL